jgi:hypothetical protein
MVSQVQVVNTLMRSPTGQKLMEEAQRRGVNIKFAPDNGDNVNGQYDPNTNTVTVELTNLETAVETLAHELVHAITPENGNSMNEEYMCFLVGEQVAKEAGVDFNPHHADFWKNHVASSYKGLAQDNGIANALSSLGLASNGAANGPAGALPGMNYAPATAAAAPNANDAAAAANYANPLNAQANPFGEAQNLGQQNAPTNMMQNPEQLMQFVMMIMQFLMQMFANMGQMMGQQQNPNDPANPLTPQNPLIQQQQPQNQQNPQRMFVLTSMNIMG